MRIFFGFLMAMVFTALLLAGCATSDKLAVDADNFESSAESERYVVEPAEEIAAEIDLEIDSDEAEAGETSPTVEVKSGIQPIQVEKPKEGRCEGVALQWVGCKKVDGDSSNLQITMINGGKGELPGVWFYFKMNDGSWLYQEYKGVVIADSTTTLPIDISEVESMNDGINKAYIYPQTEIEGELTVCYMVPVGVFVPETNCKAPIRID